MSTLTLHTFLSTANVRELQDRALLVLSDVEKQEKDHSISSNELNELSLVKSAFIDVYQIVKPGINIDSPQKTATTHRHDFNTTINEDFKLSSKEINTVISIIDQIRTKKWLKSSDAQIKSLSQIMGLFISTILMLEISKTLIGSTLDSLNDINYYDCVLSKKYAVLLYFVQTLPLNIYSLVKNLETYLIPKVEYNEVPDWIPEFSREFYRSIFGYISFGYSLVRSNITTFIESPTTFLMERRNESKSLFTNFWNSTFRLPYYYSKYEIESKRRNLSVVQKNNVSKLGYLLSNPPTIDLETSTDINFNIANSLVKINEDDFLSINETKELNIDDLYDAFTINLPELKAQLKDISNTNTKPSYFVRNWPLIVPSVLFVGSYIPSTLRNIKLLITDAKTREELYNYFKGVADYSVDTTVAFWRNWIVNPINNILKTIRHDNNSEIALMSQQSLDSDLDSLERMAVEYIIDLNKGNANVNIDQIRNSIKSGDMTLIMNSYENDLKNPIKSIVIGDMLRNILIQIQKTKVDGSLALNGVDQILKSQELVFGFVAASPSLLILWSLKNSFSSWYNGSNENSYKKLQKIEIKGRTCKSLGNIEKLIDHMVVKQQKKQGESKSNYYKNGLLFIELRNLKQLSAQLFPDYVFTEFIDDIEELIDANLDVEYKLLAIQRIWNVYGRYLK